MKKRLLIRLGQGSRKIKLVLLFGLTTVLSCESDEVHDCAKQIKEQEKAIMNNDEGFESLTDVIVKSMDVPKFYVSMTYVSDPKEHIFLDTLIFSPDSSKLMAFYIIKNKESSSSPKEVYCSEYPWNYSGLALIGILNNEHKWMLWSFDEFTARMMHTPNDTKSSMREYYFDRIKLDCIFLPSGGDEYEEKSYKYSVNQTEFWGDDNILWNKYNYHFQGGVQELFPFQLSGLPINREEEDILPYVVWVKD